MTVSEPAWRIKSRPCPFYQHGQCLFADSCNFVHNVSVKLSSGPCEVESSHKLDLSMLQTIPPPPIITVDSPRFIDSPHSPRLSGLLDALKDVIGEDVTNIDSPRIPYSPDKPTLGDESEITFVSCSSDKEGGGNMTVDILESDPVAFGSGNPSISQTISPDNDDGDADSEGYGEDEPTVRLNSHIKSASISSGRWRPSQLNIETAMAPIFDFSENDTEGVIDSGYAESWHAHSPSPRTPPRTRSSTLDLLGSPFGSPSDRIQAQVGILGQLGLNTSVEQLLDSTSDISLDCPKDCDSPRHVLVLHATEDISAGGDDVAQASLGISASDVSLRSSTDLSQSQAVIEPTNFGRKSDEQALLSRNSSDDNLLKPSLELGSHERTIKNFTSRVKNIPSGDLHSQTSALVGNPAPSDKQNSSETLNKNSLSCDTTQSSALTDNKSASCRSSPLQLTALHSSSHHSSSLNPQKRLSTSTPQQSYHVRNFMSNTTSSSADGARRMSFGWKNWGKSRARGSDPIMSTQPKQPMTRRPSESGLNSAKASDRKRSGFISPPLCLSSGCVSLNPSAVVSPGHTTIIHTPDSTNNFPHAESSARSSMLSLSLSSTKYPTPNYLPSPHQLTIPQQVSTFNPTLDATVPSPLSFTSLDLKNFSENAHCSTDFVDCHDSLEFRFSKQSLEPPLYRIDETEDRRIEDQRRHGYFDSHDPEELSGGFLFPKRNLEPPLYHKDEHEDSRIKDQYANICPIPTPTTSSASRSSGSSLSRSSSHAIAMPKPTLFFAIASDNVDEVRKVLERGEVGPNEFVGPQSALEFILTNDQLIHKAEMVKILLAYGADPSVVKKQHARTGFITPDSDSKSDSKESSKASTVGAIDPATSYFLERAEAAERQRTTAMIRRSSFQAITRVRYEVVGQDRVLEHLFKVLSIHARQLSPTPLVVLLSGPSGHGKSMLARKFGSLLEVPTHIVNMTTLRAPHELWQSHSMDPDNHTSTTLAKFLTKHEGKRCVVVLDEIEKTADEKVLWPLLMPWEHGRCSIEAGSPPIDVHNVVWIGTSNVGQDLVFEYQGAREVPQEPISKEEYSELMELLRPKMSAHLGTSVVSRVTAVLPFVPFTAEERRVICFEALYSLAGVEIRQLASMVVDRVIENALAKFRPEEGARSLYRAISEQLAIHL